ncbi:hypothetical protein K402DRAFT_188182 [Aulographum hederae CBS 113979]|uniref:Uncharacterized protein n=1 Tax=Aulographum hederae CBS 113979 TaxID=1176131 RepID=A0A6G1GPY3_9PEZI|nr:hypothetical protein K402DRAFT_188182 [Aulographum hederae CBS 113979]
MHHILPHGRHRRLAAGSGWFAASPDGSREALNPAALYINYQHDLVPFSEYVVASRCPGVFDLVPVVAHEAQALCAVTLTLPPPFFSLPSLLPPFPRPGLTCALLSSKKSMRRSSRRLVSVIRRVISSAGCPVAVLQMALLSFHGGGHGGGVAAAQIRAWQHVSQESIDRDSPLLQQAA